MHRRLNRVVIVQFSAENYPNTGHSERGNEVTESKNLLYHRIIFKEEQLKFQQMGFSRQAAHSLKMTGEKERIRCGELNYYFSAEN